MPYIEVKWLFGVAFGVIYAYHALWLNFGPCQVVIGQPYHRYKPARRSK